MPRSSSRRLPLALAAGLLSSTVLTSAISEPALAATEPPLPVVRYHTAKVDGVDIFYREAGPASAPTVLLLHGFPTSSHMFRNLIPALADRYHVIAYKRDLPDVEFHLIDTGHFALEDKADEMVPLIRDFLSRKLPQP